MNRRSFFGLILGGLCASFAKPNTYFGPGCWAGWETHAYAMVPLHRANPELKPASFLTSPALAEVWPEK